MATKKATPKPAAVEKPHRVAKRTTASKPKGEHAEGPMTVEQRLQVIETVLGRVLNKLATHGMAIRDEPEEEEEDETGEPETGEPAEG